MAHAAAESTGVNGVAASQADGVLDRGAELSRPLKLPERREPLVVQVTTWMGLGIIEGMVCPGRT
jgi:hypothetical protein